MKPLNKTMFREYDIRGKVNQDELSENAVSLIASSYAVFLKRRQINTAILGYDYRDISERFHDLALEALLVAGINVIDIGMCLTPMMYAAQYHFESSGGMMITASHNPNGWSGFKLAVGFSETLGPNGIREIYEGTLKKPVVCEYRGAVQTEDFLPMYTKDIMSRVSLAHPLTVVLNTGNGTAGPFVTRIFSECGLNVIGLYTDLDWSFPHYYPNPSLVEMMKNTGDKVVKSHADIGIAIDGDGDRVGVTDNKGNVIWPDKFMILLARQILKKYHKEKIIFDVKSSRALSDDIKAHGGKPIMWKTGHSYMKAKMKQENAPLAGEMSGHIFYNKPMYYGFDDGVFAALKLLEYLSQEDKSLAKLLEAIPSYVSSPALQVDCPDDAKYEIVEKLVKEFKKEGYNVITISGARVEFDDGWGLVRASSNLPVLGMRFEAKTKERMEEIQKLIREKLEQFPEVGKKWTSG